MRYFVWEMARDLRAAAGEGTTDPIEAVMRISGLDRSAVELAANYYAAYPADIDERIQMDEEAAERLRHILGSSPSQSAA